MTATDIVATGVARAAAWQTPAALLVVAAAAAYVLWRASRAWKGACGTGCSTCSQREGAAGLQRKPLVTIELPTGHGQKNDA